MAAECPGDRAHPGDGALLEDRLRAAQDLGFLGEAPVAGQIFHSLAFVSLVPAAARFVDLGSGGGIPGLVVACRRIDVTGVLLDAAQRRASFLERAVRELGLDDRIEVARGRAERYGHDPGFRYNFDAVLARSFGPPAVTAECAAPLLRVGGVLLVSEPPDPSPLRWSAEALAGLGLARNRLVREAGATIQVLEQVRHCPKRWPRAEGKPQRSPLWET